MILLIFLILYQYGLACKYGIIFQILISILDTELHFLIPDVTIANQARL